MFSLMAYREAMSILFWQLWNPKNNVWWKAPLNPLLGARGQMDK
jgi:hypothetical protein